MIWLAERFLWLAGGYALGTYLARRRATLNVGEEGWDIGASPRERAIRLQRRSAEIAAMARRAAKEANR